MEVQKIIYIRYLETMNDNTISFKLIGRIF